MPKVKLEILDEAKKRQAALGARLRVERQRAGLTQAQVGDLLGVSKALASQLERGDGWRVVHVVNAARAFGLEPDDFFTGEGARGGLALSDAEASVIFAWRASGATTALRLLIDQIDNR